MEIQKGDAVIFVLPIVTIRKNWFQDLVSVVWSHWK